jgi:acetylornithine/LysW-gamma-L-lysine aminotransferase
VLVHGGSHETNAHATTLGGNPLACAAALVTIRYIESEGLTQRAAEMGACFADGLRKISSPLIREIRGIGSMIAVELQVRAAGYLLSALAQRGVLALSAGTAALRFLPPLVISRAQIDRVVAAFAQALEV